MLAGGLGPDSLRHPSPAGSSAGASSPLAEAAWSLVMETAAGAAWAQLAGEGVPAILLKGPATATWLYAGEVRPSADVDLLVSPADFERAQAALVPLGYRTLLAGAPECEIGTNGLLLLSSTGVSIDLHYRLIGVADPRERCWQVLSRHTEVLTLASAVDVHVLDLPARAMHLALHAAQNGPTDKKALADLERGLLVVTPDVWRAAAGIAEELGATPAFAAGLRLSPTGSGVADDLRLPHTYTVELALRVTSARQDSLFFARLAEVSGTRARVGLIARKLWPTADFMRANSLLAQRGFVGLFRARLARAVLLVTRAGPALRAWRTARSRIGRSLPPV